jgi:hypothetical protein
MSAPDFSAGLLVMARKDFDALRGMVDNPLFADEIFGFHAQQAIEKSLKAWLAARSVIFPLTHDLSRLLDLLEENGADVNLFWSLVQYTVFAVQARYETGLMETEPPIDRVAVIAEVQQLLATVLAETGLNGSQDTRT